MVYPDIFDLIAKNAFLIILFNFFKKAKNIRIMNYTIFLRFLDLRNMIAVLFQWFEVKLIFSYQIKAFSV